MTLVGLILTISLPVITLLYITASANMEQIGVENLNYQARHIVNEINKVYVEGEDSRSVVKFFIPKNLAGAKIGYKNTVSGKEEGREIALSILKGPQNSEISYATIPVVFTSRTGDADDPQCNLETVLADRKATGVTEILIEYYESGGVSGVKLVPYKEDCR